MSSANYEWCPVCDKKALYVGEDGVPDDVVVLHKACQEKALADAVNGERERLYDLLGRDHFVIFAEDGWTVEHSVDCRLSGNMTGNCDYWTALKRSPLTVEPDPGMRGRWLVSDIDSEGLPSLERVEQP